MNFLRVLLFAILFIGYSSPSWAWGQIGHRAVGEVAEKHLSRKAKRNMKKLLGSESLAMITTWMDEVKSDDNYDYAYQWHWVTIPNGMTYEESEKNPKGDAVEAIERMKLILKSDTASKESKLRALKFLAHLVGDIHQPLHVGNGEDRGGNNLKVKWFRSSSNLHRVWDSDLIEQKKLSYTELAKAVSNASKDEIREWQSSSVVDWAHEAMVYRDQIYKTKDPENMSYEYMYQNWSLMQNQIEKAGVRLAGVLNEIFG